MSEYAEVVANAVGVLGVVAGTALAVWRWRERNTSRRRPVAGLVAGLVVALVVAVAGAHLCDAGGAPMQTVVGAGSVFVLMWAVRMRAAAPLALLAAVVSTVLAFHATDLAHRGYPTNPGYGDRRQRVMAIELRSYLADSESTIAAGPLPAEVVRKALGDGYVTQAGEVLLPELHWRWFTPITGMWEKAQRPHIAVLTDPSRGEVRFEPVGP